MAEGCTPRTCRWGTYTHVLEAVCRVLVSGESGVQREGEMAQDWGSGNSYPQAAMF